MRNFLTLTGTSSQSITIPIGKKLRVLSVTGAWAGATFDDQIEVSFSQSQQTLWVGWTTVVLNSTGSFCFSVGAQSVPLTLTKIDPVTGVATFNDQGSQAAGALPDFFVSGGNLTVAAAGTDTGTVNAGMVIVYELENET